MWFYNACYETSPILNIRYGGKLPLQKLITCYEKLGDFDTAKEKAKLYLEKYPDDALIQKEYEFLKSR